SDTAGLEVRTPSDVSRGPSNRSGRRAAGDHPAGRRQLYAAPAGDGNVVTEPRSNQDELRKLAEDEKDDENPKQCCNVGADASGPPWLTRQRSQTPGPPPPIKPANATSARPSSALRAIDVLPPATPGGVSMSFQCGGASSGAAPPSTFTQVSTAHFATNGACR